MRASLHFNFQFLTKHVKTILDNKNENIKFEKFVLKWCLGPDYRNKKNACTSIFDNTGNCLGFKKILNIKLTLINKLCK